THGEINIVVRIDKEQWSRAYQGKDHRPRPASAVGEEEAVAVPAGPFLAGEEGQIGDTAHRGRRFHPLVGRGNPERADTAARDPRRPKPVRIHLRPRYQAVNSSHRGPALHAGWSRAGRVPPPTIVLQQAAMH